ALLISICAHAQTTLGLSTLAGTVSDPLGAPVSSARITLIEKSKGLVRKAESATSGSFLFPSVIAGMYSVQVEKTGFNSETIENVEIDVAQQAFIPVELKVGDIKTSVTVRAPRAAELSAESNSIGTLLDSDRVRELPLNGRNFLQLALL